MLNLNKFTEVTWIVQQGSLRFRLLMMDLDNMVACHKKQYMVLQVVIMAILVLPIVLLLVELSTALEVV
ncbi:hypothetical protein [Pedobacter sp. GR22-6]|uniref:hypothetical protein n=1 Tax=Pedobacter sp. GR22-6 TaxID=3127957 RepID=UPI00307CF080